jgi:hypothetical protein
MPITRTFTVAELEDLGVPPESPEDVEYSDTLLADEHIRILKYSQLRRAIIRTDAAIWAVEYEAPLDLGDFEVDGGDGTDNHGWRGDTVEAVAVVRCEVRALKWLPIVEDQGDRDWGQDFSDGGSDGAEPDFARPFNLTTADGELYHCAEFPTTGLVVLASPDDGLRTAYASVEALLGEPAMQGATVQRPEGTA